jgi:hypothetical protein
LNPFAFTVLPSFQLAPLLALVRGAPTVGQHHVGQWVAGRRCEPMQPHSGFEHYLVGLAERVERQAVYMAKNSLGFGQACSSLVFTPGSASWPWPSWRRQLLRGIHVRWAINGIVAMSCNGVS